MNQKNDNTHRFFGVFTALITPFNRDGSIDFGALKKIVEWQIQNGIQGLVPAGTTGESPTLSHKEHFQVIETVVEQTNNRVPVIAGTGSNSTEEAIALTSHVKSLGIDASLQVVPYYNKPSQEGLYAHFVTIAEKTGVPQFIYNIPGRTSKNLEFSTLQRLLAHPLIIGVKEASGNILQTIDIVHAHTGGIVFSGDDILSLSSVLQGGQGVISVASNIAPREVSSMIQLALAHKVEEAQEAYYALLSLFHHLFIETNPIPVKYVAHTLGLCEEVYRLPLCNLSDSHKQAVNTVLSQMTLTGF